MFKRMSFVVVVASVMLLVIGITPLLANMPSATSATSAGVTIPYAGRLNDDAGQPVADGAYDFIFTLYEAENGGTPVWTERQAGVTVQDGAFTALLGSATALPREALGSSARWLEVSVRAPDETEFTLLAPRQELAETSTSPAAPQALSCAHTHLGEVWNGSVAWSNGAFKVTNNQNGPSVWGVNTGGGNAVRGDGYGSSMGVYGEGDAGYGAFGRSVTGFGLGAEGGGDASITDAVGDLVLGGSLGEIFSSGSGPMTLESNYDIQMYLDHDNNSPNEWFRVFNGAGDDIFHIDQSGNLVAAGSKAGYVVDVAQNDDTVSLETGDVVVISGAGPAVVGEIPVIKVRRAMVAETSAVIGIVDKRFFSAAAHDAKVDANTPSNDMVIAPGEYLTVVTLGSFKAIKVDASQGAIVPGDLLVASSNPGYAMKAASPTPGTIIGKALGELKSGTGIIPVIVAFQ